MAYAKGERKRELILAKALEVFGEFGFNGTTIREIAARCEISHQSLMHYFPTKEALLMAALRVRDERLRRFFAGDEGLPVDELVRFARENLEHPGHVRMYTTAAAEATEVDQPAHAYYAEYYRNIVSSLERALAHDDVGFDLAPGVRPEMVARVFLAVQDGLQLQWLYDESVDTPLLMQQLLSVLVVPRR